MSVSSDPGTDFAALRVAHLARHAALVGLAGAGLGAVVGGGGGRLVMRILALAAPERSLGQVTENGNRVGEVTVGGTIELVVFVGIFAGRRGRGRLPDQRAVAPLDPLGRRRCLRDRSPRDDE